MIIEHNRNPILLDEMRMSRLNNTNSKSRNKYLVALFLYWLILLIWQNFAVYISNSILSIIIKVGLVIYLLIVFFQRTIKGNKQFLWLIFFLYSVVSFFINEHSANTNALIYYFFPAVFSLIVFVFGDGISVSLDEYIGFLKAFIWNVFFTALYAVIFQGSYFTQLLSRSSSYGYELTSFFTSNHEYGMYLSFAIASILICYNTIDNKNKRFGYILLLIFFAVNLIATLSRTSIASCLVILVVFGLLSRKSSIKWIMLAVAVILVVVFISSARIQSFVDVVLLKGGNDAGRTKMWENAINYFINSTWLNKLFGHGYSTIGDYTRSAFSHGSVHNSFLQVLLIWGISGLTFLIGVIIYSIKKAISVIRIEKNLGFVFLALSLSTIAFMFTNTACLMESPIDSFMLTVFTVVLPKFVCNSLLQSKERKYEVLEEI